MDDIDIRDLLDEELELLQEAWLPHERGLQTRPQLHKIEVQKPLLAEAKWQITAYFWMDGDNHRVSVETHDPTDYQLEMVHKLEQEYRRLVKRRQRRQAF